MTIPNEEWLSRLTYPYDNTALKGSSPGGEESRHERGDEERGTESMEKRESEAGERRGKETDIKRETEDVGLGRRLAAAAAAPLDVRRVRNYRFSERLARSASRARFESLRGPSLVAPSRAF